MMPKIKNNKIKKAKKSLPNSLRLLGAQDATNSRKHLDIRELKSKIKKVREADEKNKANSSESLEEQLKKEEANESELESEEFNPEKLESAEIKIKTAPIIPRQKEEEKEAPSRARYQSIRELPYRSAQEAGPATYAMHQDEERADYASHAEEQGTFTQESPGTVHRMHERGRAAPDELGRSDLTDSERDYNDATRQYKTRKRRE